MVNEKVNIMTLAPTAQTLLGEIAQREGKLLNKDTINDIIEAHADEHYGIKPALLVQTKDGIIPIQQNQTRSGGDGSMYGNKEFGSKDVIQTMWKQVMENMSMKMMDGQMKHMIEYMNESESGKSGKNNGGMNSMEMMQQMMVMDKMMNWMSQKNNPQEQQSNQYTTQLISKINELERKIEDREEKNRYERLERMIEDLKNKPVGNSNDITSKDMLQLFMTRDSKVDEISSKLSEERQKSLEEKLIRSMEEWRKDLREIQAGNSNKIGEMIENVRLIKEISGELGINEKKDKGDMKNLIGDLVGRTISTLGEVSKAQQMSKQSQYEQLLAQQQYAQQEQSQSSPTDVAMPELGEETPPPTQDTTKPRREFK